MKLSANKIFRNVSANPDNYGEGNYAIYGELRVEQAPGSGVFTRTLTASLTPDAADQVTFELQDGLADFFPLTDFNPFEVVTIQLITDNQVTAQFYSAEAYGTPRELYGLTLNTTFKVLNGGLPKQVTGEFFTDFLPETKQFLTWAPIRKRVVQNQPEILHFCIYDAAITEINQLVKVYFTDGSMSTLTKGTVSTVSLDQIYRIPAGYTLLDLSDIDGAKTIKKYEIWLTDQADAVISEVRTYVVDYVTAPDTRYWIFTNSLGMWEIFRAEGRKSEQMELERERSSGYLPQGYDRTMGEVRSRIIGSTEEIEVSSGYLDSKAEALWAKEILLSEKLYLLEDESRIPYVINSNQYRPYTEQDHRYFLRFTAQLAYNNTKYSAL